MAVLPEVPVVVYTRDGCGLCRTGERLVAAESGDMPVRHVDVDEDPELQRRYHVRVPVVAVDGREVAEGRIETGEVRRAIRRARWRRLLPLPRCADS